MKSKNTKRLNRRRKKLRKRIIRKAISSNVEMVLHCNGSDGETTFNFEEPK